MTLIQAIKSAKAYSRQIQETVYIIKTYDNDREYPFAVTTGEDLDTYYHGYNNRIKAAIQPQCFNC